MGSKILTHLDRLNIKRRHDLVVIVDERLGSVKTEVAEEVRGRADLEEHGNEVRDLGDGGGRAVSGE